MPSANSSSPIEAAISTAAQINEMVMVIGTQAFRGLVNTAAQTTAKASEDAAENTQRLVESATETVGRTVEPIAQNPLIDYVARVPGLGWLVTALGKVDIVKAEQEIAKLHQEHPEATPAELANRVIVNTTIAAAGTGLMTNLVPPVALALFAVDIAAVSRLQAEMLFRIAGLYGFDLRQAERRGEAMAIFMLSVGTAGAVKTGLSVVELLPGVGAAVGASSNGAIVYALGTAAQQFYERKLKRQAEASREVVG
ncbi:MAG: hypothetical protein F6J97_17625 [Leptolyngbya sp. SIO4C1]|nr:hypothetical protein [Leptolyngbya sp. SIO4C1]